MSALVPKPGARSCAAALLLLSAAAWAADPAPAPDATPGPTPVPAADASQAPEEGSASRITREGVTVELLARPAREGSATVMAADWADVGFRITDASTGEPIQGRYPAAWMDLAKAWEAKGDSPMTCRDRVETYLKGIVGVRPMIDLNSHYLLVMNRDASISVIDPAVGITGITNLFAQVNLKQPAADWAKTADHKYLYVTMPLAAQVAQVDTEDFKVTANVEAGENPTRAELQRDGRYLWVGNNAPEAEQSGVTVIDTAGPKQVAFIPTGLGHHEIAFSAGDRYAFVSNRNSGTVSVIEVATLTKVKDIATGPLPLALAVSPLSQALYVADGKDGTISVIDPERLEVRTRIQAEPGLGPMRFSPDGRWGVVVNPAADKVFAIDARDDRLAHQAPVGGQPYQVSFSRNYAFIRALGSEQVGMLPLSELEGTGQPQVKYFPAGQGAPGRATEISIADSIIPSAKEAASYVVNPAEGTVYYYMEGMNAPMGAFRNYGHEARAIEIVDRSLREREPGLYTGRVRIPVAGTYDIAFLMDTPRFLHCFSTTVVPNPEVKQTRAPLEVEYRIPSPRVPVGSSTTLRFRLSDPVSGLPRGDISDLSVLYYRSDGRGRTVVPARSLGNGLYEVDVKVATASTYYVFVGSPSEKVKYTDLPFATLMGVPSDAAAAPTQPRAQPEARP